MENKKDDFLKEVTKTIIAWGVLVLIAVGIYRIITKNWEPVLIAMLIFLFRKEIKRWLYTEKNGKPGGVLYELWRLTIGNLSPIFGLLHGKKKSETEKTNKKIVLLKSTLDTIKNLNVLHPTGKILWTGKVTKIDEKFFLENVEVARGQVFDEPIIDEPSPNCYGVSLENESWREKLQRRLHEMAILSRQTFFISCLNIYIPDDDDDDDEEIEPITFRIYTKEDGLEENVPWEVVE